MMNRFPHSYSLSMLLAIAYLSSIGFASAMTNHLECLLENNKYLYECLSSSDELQDPINSKFYKPLEKLKYL